jgi:arylsulfatase
VKSCLERYDAIADAPLALGTHRIGVDFAPDQAVPGCPATTAVCVDGQKVAETRVERQIPLRCGTECFDVGMDSRSPVCDDYANRGLFEFTDTIESVALDFGDYDEPTGMDRLELATRLD